MRANLPLILAVSLLVLIAVTGVASIVWFKLVELPALHY